MERRDAARSHDYYFPPYTPDAAPEDAQVQLGLKAEPPPSNGRGLSAGIAILTALTLSVSLLVGAVKFVAAATRVYDQTERVLAAVAKLDTSVTRLTARVDAMERRP